MEKIAIVDEVKENGRRYLQDRDISERGSVTTDRNRSISEGTAGFKRHFSGVHPPGNGVHIGVYQRYLLI